MVGLIRNCTLDIKWPHNRAELEQKFFSSFGRFHSRQPFRPILRPMPKPCRPPSFFTFFCLNMKIQYQMDFLNLFWTAVFPYFEIIQFYSFHSISFFKCSFRSKTLSAPNIFQLFRMKYQNSDMITYLNQFLSCCFAKFCWGLARFWAPNCT